MTPQEIVDAAVKDALAGNKNPSIQMNVADNQIYNCCITSILMFMRGYRDRRREAAENEIAEISRDIYERNCSH